MSLKVGNTIFMEFYTIKTCQGGSYMLNKFLDVNEKSLPKNTYLFIGHLALSVIFLKFSQYNKLPIYLAILISGLFLIKSLVSLYCIIKILVNKQ